MWKRDHGLMLLLGLALVLAFILRLEGLAAQSLWYDEGFSVNLVGQGLRQILSGDNNHPPLYHLLLGAWVRLAGASEFSVRYLSVGGSILIVALGSVFGRLLCGRRAGALTALLLAVSPIDLWYAQEARMYALLGALTLTSSVLLLRLLQGRPRQRSLWVGYALANIAALYTHYFAALILAAQAVWILLHLLRERDAGVARSWLLAQLGLGLAFLPWLPVFWPQWQAAHTGFWPGRLDWRFIVRNTGLGFFGAGLTVSEQTAAQLAIPTVGLAALGLLAGLGQRKRRWAALMLLAQVAVPLLILCALLYERPKFSPRYLLPILPAVLALAAGGLASLWPRSARRWPEQMRVGLAASVVVVLATGSAYAATNAQRDSSYGRDDLRGAARFLMQAVGPDEVVILLSGHVAPAFGHYYHRPDHYPIPPRFAPSPAVDDPVTPDTLDDLNRAIDGRQGAWLLLWQDEVVDPNRLVLTAFDLAATAVPVSQSFRGLTLRRYTFPAGLRFERDMFARQRLDAPVGQGDLLLLGSSLPAEEVPSGSAARIILSWRALRPIQHDYRLSLRVLDDLEQERAQGGGRLAGWMYPTDRWRAGSEVVGHHEVRLPPALPPGEYAVRALITPLGHDGGEWLSLGRLRVGRPLRQPTLAELGIDRPVGARLGELELLKVSLSPSEAGFGQRVYLNLIWRALARPNQDHRVALLLGERRWADLPLPAALGDMVPGDILEFQYPLDVPRDAGTGTQPLSLALLQGASAQPIAAPVALAELAILGGPRTFEVPQEIQSPRRVALGDTVVLLGSSIESSLLGPGEAVRLTLYWQAGREMATSYTVFTHLLDGQGRFWGQVDRIPVHGSRPTTGWLPGEVFVDTYEIPVQPGAPPGSYMIAVGMYDPVTGVRLPARDEAGQRLDADRILVGPITLRQRGTLPARP